MSGTLAQAVGGARRIIGGPFGSKLTTKDYSASGVPVIRGSNMDVGGRWTGGDFAFVSEEKYARDLTSNTAKPGNIVVTQRGTLGQVSIIPDRAPFTKYIVSQSQMAIDVDPKYADRNFVYYYLRSPAFVEHSHIQTIQTGVPHINLGILRDAPADFPSLSEQREIASILGALDDKIELNRRMSSTLEEMARSLYKSWFVDFDPVHAKMEGRQPAFMDEATAALFPDRFGEDGLPEGWTKVPYLDAVSIVGGGTPKTSRDDFWGGDIPWYSVVDAPSSGEIFVFKTEKTITEEGLKGSSARLLPVGATIISARGTVGKLAMVGVEMAFNQSCYGLLSKDGFGDVYAYFSTARAVELLQSMAHGSVFATITRKTFEGIEVTRCEQGVMDAFETKAGALTSRMLSLSLENQTLAALRDSLLPKLMSGELRVGEAREQVEEVA